MPPHSEKLTGLLRMSAVLSHASKAVAAIFLLVNAAMWLVPGFALDAAHSQTNLGAAMKVTLTTETTLLALVVSTFYVGLLAIALWSIARLFDQFSKGAIFVPETGAHLRRAGLFLFFFAILSPTFRTVIGVIVTIANPPGQKELAIGIGSQEIVLGLIAALLVMLGHIMAEAAHIADDNRQIV